MRCVTRLPAEESVQSRGSSVRPPPTPFSVHLPQLLLFSASGPFHPKRQVPSIFGSLPLPHNASEYVWVWLKSGGSFKLPGWWSPLF